VLPIHQQHHVGDPSTAERAFVRHAACSYEDETAMDSDLQTPRAFPKLDCLVVDDDPLIRLCLETIVRSAGHLATSASDGAEAVNILSTHRFDLVISDIRMPNLDGWGCSITSSTPARKPTSS
jgi:PleD family two-component response regulator